MRKKQWIGITLCICLMLWVALAPAYAQPAAPKAIKIGIMISMTGPDAAIGRPAKDGYEMAAAKIQ